MFERLQKPFLTVETGEAYQPIRVAFAIKNKEALINALNQLKCCERSGSGALWNWFWSDECEELHFESVSSYERKTNVRARLGTIAIKNEILFITLPSFKRACHAASFFHQRLQENALIHHADFINKVFGTDERLPHGFTELFKDDELENLINQRLADYEKVQKECESAQTAEEAFKILSEYSKAEASKRLPYAERYSFDDISNQDPEVIFLSFYIFLRSRELVAIRRWFGESGYSLSDATDETVESVFGGMNLDIIE